MEQSERKIVRVVVVGDPAPDEKVDSAGLVPALKVLGHRSGRDGDFDAELRPVPEESRRERLVLVLQDRVDGRPEPDRELEARRADHLRRLVVREVRLPASRIVAEDPGRKQAGRGKREASERSPYEVLRPDRVRERLTEPLVRADG